MAAQRTYLAIDLKSFYASVECVDRHLDPLTTNLVVADASRTEKTICLAVSPSLKAYKIPGRARLFEAVQRVREVNAQRLQTAIRQKKVVRGEDGKYHFASTSFDANALNADPALGLSYIVAPPRMQRYLDVSTQIYKTYLKYVSPADIYPYSIDEVFIDVTGYLPYYHMSAHELAMTMVREVLTNTGITATAGIGTNLYLAKLAMDIVAKHIPADKDGVRIAELDEQSYRYLLWNHRPLTDFWMTGPGTVKRLEAHGIYTMGDLARFSIHGEDRLYEIFGVDAEILIDHAWGYEPCGMAEIKSYKPSTNSISEGQVLTCPYPNDKAKLIVREMAEILMFRLTEKKLVMDRTKSGIVDFGKNSSPHEIEAHDRRKTTSINYIDDFALATWAPIQKENEYKLDVFVDKCSVEIFLDGGKIAMTNLIFPTEPYNRMCFYSKGGTFAVDSFSVYRLGL